MSTVWVGQRIYESRIVYENVFGDKEEAKSKLEDKQNVDEINWEGMNYEDDPNVEATEGLELNEKLQVKRYTV